MDKYLLKRIRTEAKAIFRESLRPVNPYGAVKNFVRIENDRLILGKDGEERKTLDLNPFDRISLVGGGKATASMAEAWMGMGKVKFPGGKSIFTCSGLMLTSPGTIATSSKL